jgi:hypothetical protein
LETLGILLAIPTTLELRRRMSMVRKRREAKGHEEKTVDLSEAAAAMGRKGGKASTPAKRKAARRNVRKRWAMYAAKIAKAQ